MFDVFFGFHSIQWSYSPVSAAGAAGFAPPALPGAIEVKEGVLGINKNGDKRVHELFWGCSPEKSAAGMFHPNPQSQQVLVRFSTDQEAPGS